MPDELKKVRKGTKSCTECRRRKVRCTWSSEEAPKCRRCEERGSNCVAQIYSVQSASSRRLTSRDRIARLEQQITNLSKALQDGNRNQSDSLPTVKEGLSVDDGGSDSDSSDTGSLESGGFTQEPPAHLHNLFENDLLSTHHKQNTHQIHRSKALIELATATRHKLQELIPPRKEVEIIASFATQWLALFHALFPASSMIKTGQDIVEHYEKVKSSTIEPTFLASWLMSLAMTIHQVPKGELGPEHQLKGFRNPSHFSRSVSDAVEISIMRHDAILGSIQGIDTAMLWLRLQLSRGNFKKTWLQLRRVIAVAELIGLHRAARHVDTPATAPREGDFWSEAPTNSNYQKAQVWESLCSIDRIAGMLFNLPPGTRRYRLPLHANIYEDGKVSLRAYLCSLSEICMKIQDLDDLELPDYADTELYATVLKIDGELRVLSSVTPASWWNNPTHQSDHLLQYWHFYISIRVHLPFTLRHDTGDQFSFSRLACMKACQTLAVRYRILRGRLPHGFFLCRIVDLQAFTALVVLVLAYHAANPVEKANLHAQGSQPPETLVPEVLDFMRSIASDPVSNFARQAIHAVGSLNKLLEGEEVEGSGDLKLKVPLLGKVNVRRKRKSPVTNDEQQPHGENGTQPNFMQMYPNSQVAPNTSTLPEHAAMGVNQGQDEYMWDPLSWSIEDDQEGVFQDAIMEEDFSPFGTWWDPSGVEYGMANL